ncbi:MAG: Druantia anti-phage system protein DruA [Gammaproteobacteria bacterium]
MERYHYLGYTPLSGAQLRYFIRAGDRLLALLGFGAAAWQLAPRDQFIGWSDIQRQQKLHLAVNNARFLILPWVRAKGLASRVLAIAARQLPEDWFAHYYGYRPVLMETFVEQARFRAPATRPVTGSMSAKSKDEESSDPPENSACR